MLADNNTPYAATGFERLHRNSNAMAVIAVRATFDLSPDGNLTLSDKQELVLRDLYADDPATSALLRVSDLIPFKPQADVTVLAQSYPPEGKPSIRWHSGVKVDHHAAILRINGVRQWVPEGNGWKLGPAENVSRVPLDYRYASGGRIIGDLKIDMRNPLGEGILDKDKTPHGKPYFAPMIDVEEHPVVEPFTHPEPQGFAPIPPWWTWREQFAGTRDEKWQKEVFPNLPADFDYRFYQSAHPNLRLPGFMRGNELVQLALLQPNGAFLSFSLPGVAPYAKFSWVDGREVSARLNCDGLHIDMRQAPYKVDLTWRGWCVICPQFFKIDLFEARLGDALLNDLVWSGEEGLRETQK